MHDHLIDRTTRISETRYDIIDRGLYFSDTIPDMKYSPAHGWGAILDNRMPKSVSELILSYLPVKEVVLYENVSAHSYLTLLGCTELWRELVKQSVPRFWRKSFIRHFNMNLCNHIVHGEDDYNRSRFYWRAVIDAYTITRMFLRQSRCNDDRCFCRTLAVISFGGREPH